MKRFSLTSDALNNTCWLNPETNQLTLPSWQFQRKTITYWVWERSYWVRYWGSKYYASHFWHLCLVFCFCFLRKQWYQKLTQWKNQEKKSLVSELFTLHCSSEPKGFPCKIQMWPPDSVAARTTFILVRDVSLTRLQAFSFLNLRHTMLIHCSENPRTQRVWGFNHSFNKYSLGAYNPHGDSEQTGLTQTLPLQTSRWDKQ